MWKLFLLSDMVLQKFPSGAVSAVPEQEITFLWRWGREKNMAENRRVLLRYVGHGSSKVLQVEPDVTIVLTFLRLFLIHNFLIGFSRSKSIILVGSTAPGKSDIISHYWLLCGNIQLTRKLIGMWVRNRVGSHYLMEKTRQLLAVSNAPPPAVRQQEICKGREVHEKPCISLLSDCH